MKLVIDRERWIRGDSARAALRRADDGMMCCLGFFLTACGVPEAAVTDLSEPPEAFERPDQIPPAALFLVSSEEVVDEDYVDPTYFDMRNSADANSLMRANDDRTLDEQARESRIVDLFAGNGVDVTFVDRRSPLATDRRSGEP